MPSCICFSQVLLYADDTAVLFFAAKTAIELEASLNTDVNRISSCVQENEVFLLKCERDRRLKLEDSVSLSCDGSSLTESESFKYLDVVIDQHMSFNNHIAGAHSQQGFKKIGCSQSFKNLYSHACS